MEIRIRKYRKTDFKNLDECLVRLQDFLVEIDSQTRLRRASAYSPKYAKTLLEEIQKFQGAVFLAFEEKQVVGCIAGIVEKQSEKNLLMCVPTRAGRILELYVSDEHRRAGIGQKLMEKMEGYMKQKKCDAIRVEVFRPNQTAHQFYSKLGYGERLIDMMKIL